MSFEGSREIVYPSSGTPWIAVNPDYPEVNAAAQVGHPGSVFEHYRRLVDLRHADPVVTDGDFELLLPGHPAIWAFLRRGRHAELLVAANFSADVVAAALPLDREWAEASVVLTSLPDTEPLQPRRTSSSAPGSPSSGAVPGDHPIAAAMISLACSWMAARCPGPRNDSA